MERMMGWQEIAEAITQTTAIPFHPGNPRQVGGGCINQAVILDDGSQSYFVKLNQPDREAMFQAELAGLDALAATAAIRVPIPVCTGTTGSHSFIVMEQIEFGPSGDSQLAALQLVALHRHTHSRFGWHRDNTIGSTHQLNNWHDDWISFWRKYRLGNQLALAARQGFPRKSLQRGEQLLTHFPALIDHTPDPSLLHGDLWGGNLAYDSDGNPVIFDPACYYGDREAELAMTELFGGFGQTFYQAYNDAWPLADGYRQRKTLYNLYHILNHFNMFGGGYAGQAVRMIDQLLAELGH